MEDEFETMKPATAPKEFERWNLEDLKAYKTRLLDEVARIDSVIEDKPSVFSEADNLFKS
jgi:hypothetical protein